MPATASDSSLPTDQREVVDATLSALNDVLPVTLSPSQMASAAGRLSRTAWTQPLTVARRAASFAAEGAKIAIGASDVAPTAKDRRFADDWFSSNPIYRRAAQAQVALESEVDRLIDDLDLDDKSRLRSEFLAGLVTSAVAPTNTLAGNPAAIKEAARTRGRSLVDGTRHALYDLRNNGAMPSMVDSRPFVPGETVAVTPGSVVFQNPVLQLIQYTPMTAKVHRKPLLVVPPQINKYYFLDLAPGRSLVEHLVANGHTVFMISWRNPGPKQADWNMDTYLQAVLDASDAALAISGSPDLNLLGVCAGGITSAALLGHLAAIGDTRINSASLVVTILDWDVPSTIGSTMMSGPVCAAAKRTSAKKGVLAGDDLAKVFSWLRPNDLVWNYVVNNYLMGKNPPAFDILAWNTDSTNLPAGLHADFLDIAVDGSLTRPGGFTALGSGVDLGSITCDSYVVGAVNDHITPWKGCFEAVRLLGGDSRFVLSSQGHIQALVNPPGNPKGAYFTNDDAPLGAETDADEWHAGVTAHTGSWWDDWTVWLRKRAGTKIAAPTRLGDDDHPPIMAAPGSYVLD